ncbi:Mak10 subunit, NatC N-terminal acetyltransferase-domain-containing protein [Pisolithus marmoratus]|nr:Mak10 subunit, NatC N-terminal acetyltransferase-domain-containing protein [Pisolithus marmoratus]
MGVVAKLNTLYLDAVMDDGYQMLDNDNYEDVTALFEQASQDMQPGTLLFDKDFSLHEAMAAFEIGEPRFDSGLALLDDSRPPFDPLAPLLPEEVCWIIDRTFSCEMAWHTGYTLSQTVFSFLYVHALSDIDPDTISQSRHRDSDRTRPIELVSVALRASVLGLLKCCDLAWRELIKGNVYDFEDWQSDKCDVPMSETYPVSRILGILDEACIWIRNSCRVRSTWRTALSRRLVLRKTLVELLSALLSKDYFRFRPLIDTARTMLQHLRASPPPPPLPSSPALRAFDPQFPRVLVSALPLHPVQLPEQSKVWDMLAGLLDSLEQLSILIEIPDLSTWDVVGTLRIWQPKPNQSLAFIRSAFQSAIYENGIVLNKYLQKHVADCFFMEALQISYDSFISSFRTRWVGPDSLPLSHIERTITELMVGRVKSHWYNPPRRRRYCMKSLFDWHELYALLTDVQKRLVPVSGVDVVARLRPVVLMRRFETIGEIILSGFQLSLYSANERPLAYWYLARVLEQHLACLDEIIEVLPSKQRIYSISRFEFQFRARYLTALQALSLALFAVTVKTMGSSLERLRLNFLRRYKWAFVHEYEDIDIPPVGHPNFLTLTTNCRAILQDKEFSPAEQVELAERLLTESDTPPGRMAGPWTLDRMEFVSKMAGVCRDLKGLPKSMDSLQTWDVGQLVWDPDVQPWFPIMRNPS